MADEKNIDVKANSTFDSLCTGMDGKKLKQLRASSNDMGTVGSLKAKEGVDGKLGGLFGKLSGSREAHFDNASAILQTALEQQTGMKPTAGVIAMIDASVRGKLDGAENIKEAMSQIRAAFHEDLRADIATQLPANLQNTFEQITQESVDYTNKNGKTIPRSELQGVADILNAATPEQAVQAAVKQLKEHQRYDSGGAAAKALLARGDIDGQGLGKVYATALLEELKICKNTDLLRANKSINSFASEVMQQSSPGYIAAVKQRSAELLSADASLSKPLAHLQAMSDCRGQLSGVAKDILGSAHKTASEYLKKAEALERLGANAAESVVQDALVLRTVCPDLKDDLRLTKDLQKLANQAINGQMGATDQEQQVKQGFLDFCKEAGDGHGVAVKARAVGIEAGLMDEAGQRNLARNLAQQAANKVGN